MNKLALALSVVAVLCIATQAQADVLDPSSITVTASSADGASTPSKLLNGSASDYWRTSGNALTNRTWGAGDWVYHENWWGGDSNPTLTFVFDDAYMIDSVSIVNHGVHNPGSDEAKRGVSVMDILVSYDGVNFVMFAEDYKLNDSFYTNDLGSRSWSVQPDEIDFGGVEIMGVQFVIKQNQQFACYGGFQGVFGIPYVWEEGAPYNAVEGYKYGEEYYANNTYVGLSSVAFNVGIPEPATMSLLALGGLALLRRKRA